MRKLFYFSGMLLLVVTAACSSSSTSSGGSGLGDAEEVTGTVFAPNGTDPISGATVYIEGTPAALKKSGVIKSIVQSSCAGDTTVSCDDPVEDSCASACTCSDGTYTLDTSACSADATEIKFCKGSVCGTATLDCESDPDNCTANMSGSTTAGSTANIAVVTGAYDEIENVLAKLGFGEIDADGELEIGTENFDIFRGGGGRDSEYAGASTTTYPEASALLGDADVMAEYDIIFINCGADTDVEAAASASALVKQVGKAQAHALSHSVIKKLDATVTSNLQEYVAQGGRLYVTDYGYDFVEQAFPSFMKFKDDPDDSTIPGTESAAKDGASGIVSDATINSADMISWLEGASITTNTIDEATSPNSGNCETTVGGNSGADNLNDDETIRIGDFLPAWVAMDGAHSGVTPEPYVWIEGTVTVSGSSSERPLTVSQEVGDEGGCILYSSYHTSHTCPTTGFWPQERVLQYLVLETAASCTPVSE